MLTNCPEIIERFLRLGFTDAEAFREVRLKPAEVIAGISCTLAKARCEEEPARGGLNKEVSAEKHL